MADLADNTAAVAAGYKRIQGSVSGLFFARYEKPITGMGHSGQLLVAEGNSPASQGAADTAALLALNNQRKHRYGGSPGRASADAVNSPSDRGVVGTIDAT